MTSGECLISFATAPWTCLERGGSEKIQNENMSPVVFEPIPRQSTTGKSAPWTARPRGLDGDQGFNVLQDNRIHILKNCYLTTRVILIIVTCVFGLNVRLNFHFSSQCRF